MTTTHQVSVADTDVVFDCVPGQTVLDAAEAAGWTIPYSCRRGACTSCLGTIVSGTVRDRRSGRPDGPGADALLCQAVPDGPVGVRPRRIAHSGPPRRRELTARVYRVRRPAPRVVVLELRYPIGRRIPFRAGQYLEVRLPGAESRPYSLANPPRDNDMAELHVRVEPGGLFSDRTARHLRPGDLLTVEAPYGDTTVEPGTEPLVLLATGTGFAPVRSVLLDQVTRRAARPTTLYWGGRDESDLYQLDTVVRWSRALPWLTVHPVLSRPDRTWPGATGHVQEVAAARHPDLTGHTVYACGNPDMTRDARELLTTTSGLPEERFLADAFVPVDASPIVTVRSPVPTS
jgi:NAD(P)H-flavin reductase/ferredoxin